MADDKRKALEEVFDLFDTDKSGSIDKKELKSAVKEYYKSQGEEVADAQVDTDVAAILSTCDSSHDDKIDKAEWFKFFKV